MMFITVKRTDKVIRKLLSFVLMKYIGIALKIKKPDQINWAELIQKRIFAVIFPSLTLLIISKKHSRLAMIKKAGSENSRLLEIACRCSFD